MRTTLSKWISTSDLYTTILMSWKFQDNNQRRQVKVLPLWAITLTIPRELWGKKTPIFRVRPPVPFKEQGWGVEFLYRTYSTIKRFTGVILFPVRKGGFPIRANHGLSEPTGSQSPRGSRTSSPTEPLWNTSTVPYSSTCVHATCRKHGFSIFCRQSVLNTRLSSVWFLAWQYSYCTLKRSSWIIKVNAATSFVLECSPSG